MRRWTTTSSTPIAPGWSSWTGTIARSSTPERRSRLGRAALLSDQPAQKGRMPRRMPGALLGPVGQSGQTESGIDPHVAEGLGLPLLRPMTDPRQAGEIALL